VELPLLPPLLLEPPVVEPPVDVEPESEPEDPLSGVLPEPLLLAAEPELDELDGAERLSVR
jgi:hypothetical protein